MSGTTLWWQSKTVWGSFVAMAAGLTGIIGLDLSAPLQNEISDILYSGGALVGGALSLYGRIKAVGQLIWTKKP
jgi:hypothetical protein